MSNNQDSNYVCNFGTSHICKKIKIYSLQAESQGGSAEETSSADTPRRNYSVGVPPTEGELSKTTENIEIRAIAPYLDNDFPSRPQGTTPGTT